MPAPFTFQPGYIQMYVLTPVKVLENLFTFQPGYIQILTGKLIRLALEIFTFQPGYIQIKFAFVFEKSIPDFTFQPGYIQMELSSGKPSELSSFTFQPGYIQMSELATLEDVEKILYIPTWLYSNPSPIIPSIQDILNPIFCLPGYSQVQNYYGGCILLLLNIHLPLFYNICRTLYIL